MSRTFRCGLVLLAFHVLSGAVVAQDTLKSGLQPGDSIPGAFRPLNVTGPHAGEKHCLVCEHGLSPVVMIFARDVSEPLVRLITELEEATAKNRNHELGSFVVFLSDRPELEKQLQQLGTKLALRHLVLSIDEPNGPEDYKVAKDTDITVVLYREHKVHANYAFRKGLLTDVASERILADLPKILAKK